MGDCQLDEVKSGSLKVLDLFLEGGSVSLGGTKLPDLRSVPIANQGVFNSEDSEDT